MPKKKEKKWHYRIVVDGKPATDWEIIGNEDYEPENSDAAYDAAHDSYVTNRVWHEVAQR